MVAGWTPATIGWRTRLALSAEAWGRRASAAVALEGERRTWFNTLPVAFGLGIGAYFAADREPLWWGPPLAIGIFALAAWLARLRPLLMATFVALCVAAAGLLAGMLRTERVQAPVLERTMLGTLSGFIESIDERSADQRLLLLVTGFAALPQEARPRRVRITLRKTPLLAGEHIALTARLMPPPEAARPGGYDFARDAFFRGFGAVGSGLGAVERMAPPHAAPLSVKLIARIDLARNAMTERIAGLVGGQAGAVAAALVTGKRGLITEETNEILRGAGIYHIVSISGLHMVLAAGAIFWLARAGLAIIPGLALAWPLKKIAASCAMLGASAYCVFSGSEVATERSLIMTLIMLGAILVDRPALSMRNLALAALVVLALEPDSLLGPSFQMSFGAVAALIAFAEWQRRRPRSDAVEPGWFGRALGSIQIGIAGLVLTSLLAAIATGPFAAYHFQTMNPFGLIGNLMALPFVSLIVMPSAVVGALLYPLGLDAIAWWVMGLATEPVLAASRFVASFAGSTRIVPAFGPGALAGFAAALLAATLFTTWLRWLALAPLATALALAMSSHPADLFIDREASGLAARTAAGPMAIVGSPSAFVVQQWLRAAGDARRPDDPGLRMGAACDGGGCIVTLPGRRIIAWSRDPLTIAEDCGRADLVVTPLRWDGACKALMVDRRTLDRHGAMSVRSTPQGLVAGTGRDPDAPRPWSRREVTPLPQRTPVASTRPAAEPVSSGEPD